MHHAQKFLLVAAAALAVVFGCASVQKTANMAEAKHDPAWAKIDSLDNLGQYKSALEATEAVLASARAAHDWRTEFRAWMYKARFMQFTGAEQKDRPCQGLLRLPLWLFHEVIHQVFIVGPWNASGMEVL